MKKTTSTLFIAALLLLTFSCKKDGAKNASDAVNANSTEGATEYSVNTDESVIEWTGSKQTGKHTGTIKLSEGTIYVKENKVVGGTFTMDMNTISANDLEPDDKAQLEGHLKGTTVPEKDDHFFNIRKYPTAKFEITNIHLEQGKTLVAGNLTIKETTKNIQFPAIVNVNDHKVSIVSDSFIIDRTQWKVNYGSKTVFQDLGDKFVNDEIELRVDVKASR